MHLLDFMALLSLALLFAKLLGGIFDKFGIPSVLAELFTGILIGNLGGQLGAGVEQFETSHLAHAFSELGVLLLLFMVGLETDIKEITKVGKDATFAAILGVAAPFALAFLVVPFFAKTSFEHTLFIAATLTATSVGITARVLQDSKKLATLSGQIILGAAVIDDVLGIIVLAIVSAIITQGSVSAGDISLLLFKVLLFGVFVFVFKKLFLTKAIAKIRPLEVAGTATILLISLTMLVSWVAEKAGLAGIIGAFALGVALEDIHFKGFRATQKISLEDLMKPITDFLVPVFFIVMGMSVKLNSLGNPESLKLAAVLIIIGIIGKFACGLGVTAKARKAGADRILVGYGMIPRGEVGLIFAAMGLKLAILSDSDYAAVVAMVAVTTLLAPGLIAWRARKLPT